MKTWIFGVAALAAEMCFGATTEDGVTKERRGALGPNDTVVTDVDATGIVAARTYTKAEVDRRIATNAPVRSVNGKSGAVTLGAGDVGALPNNRDGLKANANFRNAVWDVQIKSSGDVDTNAVLDIVRDEIIPATNRLYTTLNGSIDVKRGKSDLAVYEVVRTENTNWTLVGNDGITTQCTSEWNGFGFAFYKDGVNVAASDTTVSRDAKTTTWAGSPEIGYSGVATRTSYMDESIVQNPDQHLASVTTNGAGKVAEGDMVKYDATNDRFVKAIAGTDYIPLVTDETGNKTAVTIGRRKSGNPVGAYSLANGIIPTASGYGSHAEGDSTTASGYGSHAEGAGTTASGYCSHAEGYRAQTRNVDDYSFAWNGDEGRANPYTSHGPGTFNINPAGGLDGFYIGEQTLAAILTNKADKADISATDPAFSNAVLAVGLNIDTNAVAVLNDISATFGGFPIEGTATTVGGLLAALAAAAAWLKKNKVGSFASVGGATATVENGVAKLEDFFKESNSLLNGRLVYERNATGLKDRAFNTLSFDGTEFNLSTALAAVTPTASGQPRDLLIVATATAATTISFTAGTIKGDKPTIYGAGTWLITLTEYAANTWYCRQIKMEDAA